MPKPRITAERARELFAYDAARGRLIWIKRTSNRIKPGRIVSTRHPEGYICVRIDRRLYLAHHVIWLWMTGKWPPEIDHRNQCRDDNRWSNLRIATRSQNNYNTTTRSDNTSGYKGVWWHAQRAKWCAQIHIDRRKISLGLFHSKEEAARAYANAAIHLHKSFARL